ncbi:MAG: hypothetical protein VCE43_18510 [Myxococcota bacterium]
MLKRGIVSLGQLEAAGPASKKLISAALLLELEGALDDHRASLRERVIRGLLLPNTTGKTTWSRRFDQIDTEIANIARERFREGLSCLDLGVSDGTTAVELFRKLEDIDGLIYTMTDMNGRIFIRCGRFFTDVCDDDGSLVQFGVGPFVIPVTRLSHIHPFQLVNRLLFVLAWSRRERVREDWKKDSNDGDSNSSWKSVSLLAPEAQSLVANEPRVDFRRLNLFSPPRGQYQLVRMMNVLNLKRADFGFSHEEAAEGLRSVLGLVGDGGLLLVGRTSRPTDGDPVTRATLVEKTNSGLRAIWRIEGGSELEQFMEIEVEKA